MAEHAPYRTNVATGRNEVRSQDYIVFIVDDDRGIGRETVRQFLEEGVRVMIAAATRKRSSERVGLAEGKSASAWRHNGRSRR